MSWNGRGDNIILVSRTGDISPGTEIDGDRGDNGSESGRKRGSQRKCEKQKEGKRGNNNF